MPVKIVSSASDLPWDCLDTPDYPFLRRAFLEALERSESVGHSTGWEVHHLCLESTTGDVLACAPSYLKSHSYGEYVFDWAWADAYHRHGLEYYPKLLTAIPFTPCVGPRLLNAKGLEPLSVDAFLSACSSWVADQNLTGWHVLFPDESDEHDANWVQRTGTQYHWYNRDYGSFDDYLAAMSSRKRKNIKKERQRVRDQGILFDCFEGHEVTPEVLDTFYVFYQATYAKRGQQGYLKRSFFREVVAHMPENVFLVLAKRENQPVAASLFFKDANTIYGRYWGCLAEYDQLHFETCYYQGIDYAIQHGIRHFDAGAQGEHKIQRGFEPIRTYSQHWIAHEGFREAIAEFVKEESRHIQAYIEEAKTSLPFKAEK